MNDREYKMTVMIVEDEQRILDSITRKISVVADDCQIVATATNGAEALELVEKIRPNIVFTDIKMPVMDGLELAKRIRTRFPNTYVVIISGFSDFTFAQEAIKYGVFSYLLKPLDENRLRDVINDIRVLFEDSNVRNNRRFTISKPVLAQRQPLNHMFSQSKLYTFLFCFDNLCSDNTDEILENYYAIKLSQINWEVLVEKVTGEKVWFVTEEKALNQEILVLAIDAQSQDIYGIAQRFCEEINALYGIDKINVCCHLNPISQPDIWFYTKRMRNVLHQSVVFGKPAIYILEKHEGITEEKPFDIIKQRVEAIVKSFEKRNDYDKFILSAKDLIHYLDESCVPQRNLEKIIVYLFTLLEKRSDNYDAIASEQLQSELQRSFCQSHSLDEIEKNIFACLKNFLNRSNSINTKKDIQAKVLDYVDKNFLTIDKIEDVADKFHYNTTYLSRMFKKVTGISILKYITNKRIEYAKLLIELNPDIGLGTIGAMVGYGDQHYFSRIFKLVVGVSPSEYRGNCI